MHHVFGGPTDLLEMLLKAMNESDQVQICSYIQISKSALKSRNANCLNASKVNFLNKQVKWLFVVISTTYR